MSRLSRFEERQKMYKQFIDIYWQWYRDTEGVIPRINGAEGKALKAIIAHYIDICSGDNEKAITAWSQTLRNWEKLPAFYRQQKDLKQINSNLNAIIRKIKKTSKARISNDYKEQLYRDLFS